MRRVLIDAVAAVLLLSGAGAAQSVDRLNALQSLGWVGHWSVAIDAGPEYYDLTNDLFSLYLFTPWCYCMGFGNGSASGEHVALRGTRFFANAVGISGSIEYIHVATDFADATNVLVVLDTISGEYQYYQQQYSGRFSVDQLLFTPSVRYYLFPEPVYVEFGFAVGAVVGQFARSVNAVSPDFYFPDPADPSARPRTEEASTSHVGSPGIQFALLGGAGGTIPIIGGVALELAIRTRFPLTSFFAESSTRFAYTVEPTLGISYLVP